MAGCGTPGGIEGGTPGGFEGGTPGGRPSGGHADHPGHGGDGCNEHYYYFDDDYQGHDCYCLILFAFDYKISAHD